jgi:hypothetical protein
MTAKNHRAIEAGLRFRSLPETLDDVLAWYPDDRGYVDTSFDSRPGAPGLMTFAPGESLAASRGRERVLLEAWRRDQGDHDHRKGPK